MKLSLQNAPIKRKLIIVILLTTGFALLLLGSALITYELLTFRRSLVANMEVLAEVIGANSTGALAFRDPKSAQEILRALSAEHQVTKAALYDQKGDIFVRYPVTPASITFPARPKPDGYRFSRSHLSMFQPIVQEGGRLGTIYLQADLGQMYWRFLVYGLLLLFVGIASSLGAIALTTNLQQRISVPILELARVAGSVSERPDYSVRAVKHDNDEIGQLTDAFNAMLQRIGESSAALAASEERLRLALEGSRTGSWDWNIQTGQITWDDFMYPLFGRTREEFAANFENFYDAIHPDDRDRVKNAISQAIAEKRPYDCDFRVIDREGAIRHMAGRGRVFYDTNGKAVRMSGVNMDITTSKKNEEELNRAKEAAEAANRAKDDFLAILSHELRTPLTPVLAAVAILEEDPTVPPHVRTDLAMMRRNIEVEAHLIDDLLDVTTIIRGKLELHPRPVDVRQLLGHAMESYCAAAAEKKNLRLSIHVSAEHTFVFADSARMTQVFWNLLQNSCKFTPQNGSIDVRIFNEPGEGPNQDLVVTIRDSGIGISAESLPRIFKAFEQGEQTGARTFGGLGLGLAISRAIVEMHGGRITAESAGRDQGACFTIRLPTVPAEAAEAGPGNFGSRGTEAVAPPRRLRVLLVEDHPDTARQLTRLLERAGHEVSWAGSIREARELITARWQSSDGRRFNILISDLGLPDGSGHDLMRDLARQHPIPGIALSGYGMKDDILDSMAAGFSRHITKPVDWQELKQAIQNLAADEEEA
jgi:PAS domain S-box-containing protein